MNESVIIITGGSRGIGWATAVELARRGARLCLTAKQWPDARAAEKMLTDEGARGAWAASSDVSSSESCTALVAEVLSRWQRVDGGLADDEFRIG